ncbi:MAG: OmpA family protein [Thiotrichales bacterium]
MTHSNPRLSSFIRKASVTLSIAALFSVETSIAGERAAAIMFEAPPTSYELARLLYPAQTRSLIIHAHGNSIGKEKPAPGVGFPINFEYNSTRVLAESIPYLTAMGEMLALKNLKDKSMVIEGHADATGSTHYNQALSEARAEVIRQYLVSSHSIDPSRLRTLGKGKSEPLNRNDPYDARNRRVEFRPIN